MHTDISVSPGWPAGAPTRHEIRRPGSLSILRALGDADTAAASDLARVTFEGNPFYARITGLDTRGFRGYWEEFFRYAVTDPTVRLYGLEKDGRLDAVLAVGLHGFPAWPRYLVFLGRLLRRIGLRRWWRYLNFASAYARLMRRPPAESRREGRGLWLMARPARQGMGFGGQLVRASVALLAREGKDLLTGFIDGSDRRLINFYRRLGFKVSRPYPFAGAWAALIEMRAPGNEESPC
jgi:ribosomal protein S18 acetylase RimI-like enzyme